MEQKNEEDQGGAEKEAPRLSALEKYLSATRKVGGRVSAAQPASRGFPQNVESERALSAAPVAARYLAHVDAKKGEGGKSPSHKTATTTGAAPTTGLVQTQAQPAPRSVSTAAAVAPSTSAPATSVATSESSSAARRVAGSVAQRYTDQRNERPTTTPHKLDGLQSGGGSVFSRLANETTPAAPQLDDNGYQLIGPEEDDPEFVPPPPGGAAVQLVFVTTLGRLRVCRAAAQYLRNKFAGLHATILTNVGRSRIGKSTFMNMMLARFEGPEKTRARGHPAFAVGSGRIKPVTNGVWVWSEPLFFGAEDERHALMLVDSEGTENGNNSFVTQLVSTACVFSSVLVLSVDKVISNEEIKLLNTVHGMVHAAMGDDDALISSLFPRLVFRAQNAVLSDFDVTPEEEDNPVRLLLGDAPNRLDAWLREHVLVSKPSDGDDLRRMAAVVDGSFSPAGTPTLLVSPRPWEDEDLEPMHRDPTSMYARVAIVFDGEIDHDPHAVGSSSSETPFVGCARVSLHRLEDVCLSTPKRLGGTPILVDDALNLVELFVAHVVDRKIRLDEVYKVTHVILGDQALRTALQQFSAAADSATKAAADLYSAQVSGNASAAAAAASEEEVLGDLARKLGEAANTAEISLNVAVYSYRLHNDVKKSVLSKYKSAVSSEKGARLERVTKSSAVVSAQDAARKKEENDMAEKELERIKQANLQRTQQRQKELDRLQGMISEIEAAIKRME